jgi:flagellar motility protein MotE (MotC chaperone)
MEDNMRPQHVLIPAALVSLVAASAFSEETDRYRLEKSANGYVRMDTQTGAMSICEERSGQLVCKMAADERAAFQDEVDRLQNSVKALDERVVKLENSLSARFESTLPSEEDFNKTMSYMERFLRGFMGIVKDMEKDSGEDGAKPNLQKT